MNAIIFDKIFNFSNIVLMDNNITFSELHKGSGQSEKQYEATFRLKVLGNEYNEAIVRHFTVYTETELAQKKKAIESAFGKFRNAFLKHQNKIVKFNV